MKAGMTARKPPRCGRCGAPIIFARTPGGKYMPLDKQRDLSGTSRHAVTRGVDLILYVRTLVPGEEPRPGVEHRHMPHHATCPERGRLGSGGEEEDGDAGALRASGPGRDRRPRTRRASR